MGHRLAMTAPAPPARSCPICRKPAEPAYRPFCSKRCADVDLQRWLSGAYVIPGEAGEEGDADARPTADEG
jgi:endogenous inhibitor of DNA gyrase (YacG/DUF329 family)